MRFPVRTRPRYPWRLVEIGETFFIKSSTRQIAMEQCSRATKRCEAQGRRFVVVDKAPAYEGVWLVKRVPPLPGKYAPPNTKEALRLERLANQTKPRKRKKDPIAGIERLWDGREPWEEP